nr:hypothetical protein BaRGS_015550 [Batillaria attramentaria]
MVKIYNNMLQHLLTENDGDSDLDLDLLELFFFLCGDLLCRLGGDRSLALRSGDGDLRCHCRIGDIRRDPIGPRHGDRERRLAGLYRTGDL